MPNAQEVLEWMAWDKERKANMTNEQWFCSLSTEEKAKRIINIAVNSDCDYRTIVEWLKQPHNSPK
jgi:hypothetical protein